MKKIFQYTLTACFVLGLSSCFSDLDTMPLDDNQPVSEKVYRTPEGNTGMLAKCYSSLILTGQKGGDGGDGDLQGATKATPAMSVCSSTFRRCRPTISSCRHNLMVCASV